MVNIFAPTPSMNPSVLDSIAGDTTALANPVIGTSVPAPARLAIFSYSPRPVSSALRKISHIEVHAPADSFSKS